MTTIVKLVESLPFQVLSRNKQENFFKWMKRYSDVNQEAICIYMVEWGHVEVLKWCKDHGYKWNKWIGISAASQNNFELLKWCINYYRDPCPLDVMICSCVAENGNLKMLKWVRKKGCPWDEYTCIEAARYDHIKLLKWAHQNGCRWNEEVCNCMIRNGRFGVLKWVRKRGCPWNSHKCLNLLKDYYNEQLPYNVLLWLNNVEQINIDDEKDIHIYNKLFKFLTHVPFLYRDLILVIKLYC
jgi:hypothetical protein